MCGHESTPAILNNLSNCILSGRCNLCKELTDIPTGAVCEEPSVLPRAVSPLQELVLESALSDAVFTSEKKEGFQTDKL